jgi:hypothetical protein
VCGSIIITAQRISWLQLMTRFSSRESMEVVVPRSVLNKEISVGNKMNTWTPQWFVLSCIIAQADNTFD